MFRYILMILTATNLYLYLKLRSGFGKGWWNVVYVSWAVAWAVLSFTTRGVFLQGSRYEEILFSLSFTRAVLVVMACAFFLFMDMGSLTARLIDRLAGTNYKARFFDPRKCVPVTLLLVLAVALYGYYEAWNVRRVDLVMETPKLPEEIDRLRLVHVTDTHLGSGLYTIDRFRRVMDIVRSAEPDILVLTGDIVDSRTSLLEEEAKLLSSHGAKYGAYAVLGNHEFYTGIEKAADFMKRSRVFLLRDASVDVAGITILGLDERQSVRTLPNGLYFPEDRFVLFLIHRPHFIEGGEGKIDLQLSGHTHGGQIWPLRYATQRANNNVQHLSYKGTSAIYVSNGAGFFGPPLRFLMPPEVTVIDLVKRRPI